MYIKSPILRALLLSAMAGTACAVTVESGKPLYVKANKNGTLTALQNATMRTTNTQRYGQWSGTNVTGFDGSITLHSGSIVYVCSDVITGHANSAIDTSADISVQVDCADGGIATIASGNGGWRRGQKNSDQITVYTLSNETITIERAVTGGGHLRLQGNGSSSKFQFEAADTSSWFSGTVSLTNTRGGYTYLVMKDDRWSGAVIDFDLEAVANTNIIPTGGTYNSLKYDAETPSAVGLQLAGNSSVAALSGGTVGKATVASSNNTVRTLTLTGEETTGEYTYNGTFSNISLYKDGSYSQTIAQAVELADITVDDGILQFNGDVTNRNSNTTVNGGELIFNAKLTGKELVVNDGSMVTGLSGSSSATNVFGVTVESAIINGGSFTNHNGIHATSSMMVNATDGSNPSVAIRHLQTPTYQQNGGKVTVTRRLAAGSVQLDGGKLTIEGALTGTGAGTGTQLTMTGGTMISGTASDGAFASGYGVLISQGTISGGTFTNHNGVDVMNKLTVNGTADVSIDRLKAQEFLQEGGTVRISNNMASETTTLNGGSLTVGGALTGDTLVFNGGTLTTGAGTNVGTTTLAPDVVWNTNGLTMLNELRFESLPTSKEQAAIIHSDDKSGWIAPTNITLGSGCNYTGNSFITFRDGTLTLDHVLTIAGVDVTQNATFNLVYMDNSIWVDNTEKDAPGVYFVSDKNVYQGQLRVVDSILQVGDIKKEEGALVAVEGDILRLEETSSDRYNIYENAKYNKGWGEPTTSNLAALPSRIYLADNSNLYLNDASKQGMTFGVLEVLAGVAHVHAENTMDVWNMDGILTGIGELHLVAHSQDSTSDAQHATIFRFTEEYDSSSDDAWFSGTIKLGNADGGGVQLDIGNVQNNTRWEKTLIDFTPHAEPCIVHNGDANVPKRSVLLLEGDAKIKGLESDPDTKEAVVVTTNKTVGGSYTLTLGTDQALRYYYYGQLGEGQYYAQKDEGGLQLVESLKGSLSLRKIGSNVQVIARDVTLDTVTVEKGLLAFSGELNANEVTVKGGHFMTTEVGDVPVINLHAGSKWGISGDMMSSATRLNFIGSGTVNLGSFDEVGEAVFYIPTKLDLLRSEGIGYSKANALFTKTSGGVLNLNTDNALNFIYTDTEKKTIFVATDVLNEREQTMLKDVEGRFVDVVMDAQGNPVDSVRFYADMNFDPTTGTLTATRTDKVVYTWMGEKNGTTPGADTGCTGNTDGIVSYGNIWTATGSTENTGWHEQNMGNGAGVYVDGSYVDFLHLGIHGNEVEYVDVDIRGEVAPGHIYVNTENIYRGKAAEGTPLAYGYAFTSTDNTGVIKDYGNTPTRLVKEGEGMLVIDVDNYTTGGIALRHGSIYAAVPNALGYGDIYMHDDTIVYVNYPHSENAADNYRNSVIANNFTLTEAADVTIGFAPFVYEFKDQEAGSVQSVTRHWRYLLMDGTMTGDENSVLRLLGYNSCWNKTGETRPFLELYTSGFILKNSDNAQGGLFHGTVKLENQVNTSTLTGSSVGNDSLSARWTGDLRLQLSDDYLKNAVLDATRQGVWTAPVEETATGIVYLPKEFRQTYHHLIKLDGDTTLKGLTAELLGTTPESYTTTNYSGRDTIEKYIKDTGHDHLLTYSVENEVDLVHVATSGDYTLNLNNDGKEYYYSGKMGYATQYVGTETVAPTYYDPMVTDPNNNRYGATLGETLSLVMDSTNGETGAQYIHSAKLVNLTLRGGTLGFNQLDVTGDVFMNTNTNLKLSVHTNTSSNVLGTEVNTSWTGTDKDGLVIHSGKTYTVNILAQGDAPAVIDGNVTFSDGSNLYFVGNNINASQSKEDVFLDVNGTMTLMYNANMGIMLQGINFPLKGFNLEEGRLSQKWYLAEADDIDMQPADASTFVERIVQLDSGFVGILGVEDNDKASLSNDYLTVTVLGDPRRTWTGNTGHQTIDNIGDDNDSHQDNVASHEFSADGANNGYQWIANNPDSLVTTSNKWKEELTFFNGCLVLFGNLYNAHSSTDTTVVDINNIKPGWVTGKDVIRDHSIDDEAVDYQYVEIVGEVAPLSVTVNGTYYDSTGKIKARIDDTNYVFAGDKDSNGKMGCIRDVTKDELQDFFGKEANLEQMGLKDWKTVLSKEGTGTLAITNANTYSGGTLLQGGRIVMQNQAALGSGTITISGASTLQADFGDSTAHTSTITNTVTAFNRDATGAGFGTTVGGEHYVATLVNDSDKRMIISTLTGQSDAGVLLNGHATTLAQRNDEQNKYAGTDEYAPGKRGDKYTIGVYEIGNVKEFYGTLMMQGQAVTDAPSSEEGTEESVVAGVQLNIAKKDEEWLHVGIDLSLNGSPSTALYLQGASTTLPALVGESDGGDGVSHVVTTTGTPHALTLNAAKNGVYFGNVGYGFYQNEDGMVKYNTGTINLDKKGAGSQTIGNAELEMLNVSEGRFYVSHILKVNKITNADPTTKLRVGNVVGHADAAAHTLVVGEGGILSLTGNALDDIKDGSAEEDHKNVYVLLADGATLTAHGNWTWTKDRNIDIYQNQNDQDGTEVTFNTHHFEVDPWDYNQLGTKAPSTAAHIIKLNTGNITGKNAIINITNDALDTNGALAANVESTQQGYVQIKDLNQVADSTFNITDRTTLQLTDGTSDLSKGTNKVVADGKEATLHLLEGKTTTAAAIYLGADGGQVYIGGTAVTNNDEHEVSSTDGMEVRLRAYKQDGADAEITNISLTSLSGNNNKDKATIDACNDVDLATLSNTMAAIMTGGTLDVDDVLVKQNSIIHGGQEALPSPEIGKGENIIQYAPTSAPATANTLHRGDSAGTVIEITTSGDTTYLLNNHKVYHGLVDQLNNVNMSGTGLTLHLTDDFLTKAASSGAEVIALQISGGAGRFRYEAETALENVKLTFSEGAHAELSYSNAVADVLGLEPEEVSSFYLYLTNVQAVPEPTTATLSLLALAALAARRRRK